MHGATIFLWQRGDGGRWAVQRGDGGGGGEPQQPRPAGGPARAEQLQVGAPTLHCTDFFLFIDITFILCFYNNFRC